MSTQTRERRPLAVTTITPPTDIYAVELQSVSKHFGRRQHGVSALHAITAGFPRGTLTAVMGLSGSGKSTLLQCAAGLERPTSGRVVLGGADLSKLRHRKLTELRRRRVGFVFQALNLVPTLSVAENIVLPLRLDNRRVDRARLSQLADVVGIGSYLRRMPHTLSGGQQQRVAVARALITEPDVVFADEPTAALDPATSETVMGLLRGAVNHLGQTVVVVTHAPAIAAYADRVLLLHGGHLIGSTDAPDADDLTRRLLALGRTAPQADLPDPAGAAVPPRTRRRFERVAL